MPEGETDGTEQYGPATVTCPFCLDEVEVDGGHTRYCEVSHGDCDWMVVDLQEEKSGKATGGWS